MENSHTYAKNLRALADWLESKPAFPMRDVNVIAKPLYVTYYGDKDSFLAAVRALGAGKKETDEYFKDDLIFRATSCPEGTEFKVHVNRSAVCRLVRPAQEAVYDCEPLLSQAEEAEIGL
jgi:hypothetical protein